MPEVQGLQLDFIIRPDMTTRVAQPGPASDLHITWFLKYSNDFRIATESYQVPPDLSSWSCQRAFDLALASEVEVCSAASFQASAKWRLAHGLVALPGVGHL